MPPRKKLSPEQILEQYNNWKNGEEWAQMERFMVEKEKMVAEEGGVFDRGNKDISSDWTNFLKELYGMVAILKVPGRKAKSYEQQYVRTMFFEKCEKFSIDGTTYDISNGTMVELWNCKEKIVEICNYFDPDMMNMNLNENTYQSWRKELIKLLKEFDKLYVKHIKSGYIEMNAIHMNAMKPIVNLMESNLNFHYLEQIEKKKEVPKFRHEALETKFCEHLTIICQTFKDFGQLQDHFNIKQMLHTLKTPDWRNIPPLCFYLTPLQNALDDVRKHLIHMNNLGILRCKYIIEHNEELQKKVIHMVKMDQTAQWLAGDELKQDQFKFLYKVAKVIYDTALRDYMLQDDQRVLEIVLPHLTAYYSIKEIRRIFDQKENERKKELEKQEREGKKMVKFEEEEKKMTTEEQIMKKRIEEKLNHSHLSHMSEAQKEKEKEKQEIEKYGRMWIWEGYFNHQNKEKWLACAEKIRNINPHVVQDIEDYILLEGFKRKQNIRVSHDIKKHIDNHLHEKRQKKKTRGKEIEEEEKVEDKNRNFLHQMRPPHCWNFFEDGEKMTPHVLRFNAKPQECYIDGRVESILEDIESIGMNLQRHEDKKWETLRTFTLKIFKENQDLVETGSLVKAEEGGEKKEGK